MKVTLHSHAQDRLQERGATQEEIVETIMRGESFPAKFGRVGFRKNFHFDELWRGKKYSTKQLECYAVSENNKDWLVITVIVKYF